jgi:hypothetical protein
MCLTLLGDLGRLRKDQVLVDCRKTTFFENRWQVLWKVTDITFRALVLRQYCDVRQDEAGKL